MILMLIETEWMLWGTELQNTLDCFWAVGTREKVFWPYKGVISSRNESAQKML
jgi:hypothetical protein